jgi:hypothetical protein
MIMMETCLASITNPLESSRQGKLVWQLPEQFPPGPSGKIKNKFGGYYK